MKNRYISWIILFFMLFSGVFVSAQEVTKGLNWDTICSGDVCTTTIYSYQTNSFGGVLTAEEEINESGVVWDGYVHNLTLLGSNSTYIRESTSVNIKIGDLSLGDATLFDKGGGVIDWNVSMIPDYSVVKSLRLVVYPALSEETSANIQLNITQLEKNSFQYGNQEEECLGNCNLFIDIFNGTLYNSSIVQTNELVNLSLPLAITDFESSLAGSGVFSIGLVGSYGNNSDEIIWIKSKEANQEERRPKLVVTYGVNATNGNLAIDEGINNSLPGNPIESHQQIYLVDEIGEHYLGSFDRATVLGNQTWVFNYVIGNEVFTNIPSLFGSLNVWEGMYLSYEEIVSQVETFINNTKQ